MSQAGEQAANVARNCVLASKLPESVPGTSLDRWANSIDVMTAYCFSLLVSVVDESSCCPVCYAFDCTALLLLPLLAARAGSVDPPSKLSTLLRRRSCPVRKTS